MAVRHKFVFFSTSTTLSNKRSKIFMYKTKDFRIRHFAIFWTQLIFGFQHCRLPLEWVLWSRRATCHLILDILTRLKKIVRFCPDFRTIKFRLSCVFDVSTLFLFWMHVRSLFVWTYLIPSGTSTWEAKDILDSFAISQTFFSKIN